MQRALIAIVLSLCIASISHAQNCPSLEPYAKAREIISDLQRIVAPEGIDETYKTQIGGIEQWIDIRGQDRRQPAILFVHGGPASPLLPAIWQFQRPLEEYFTMVNWDQRGAGKTYNEIDPDSIAATIRIDRYVDDAIEVAQHVANRLGQKKIILMGHSWGSIVGLRAALRRPDLFHAYVGIGQVINTRVNETLSFEYGMSQARAHGNEAAVRELEAIAPYPGTEPVTRERIVIARKWAQYYGGLSAHRNSSDYFFRAALLSPQYDADDVCAIGRGSQFSLGRLLPEFLEVDFGPVRSAPLPVVMLMGRHDYTTPSQPTSEWLSRLQAPYKEGVWFDRSAHMIPWEEPGKFLVSLLRYVRPLAERENRAVP